jgi:hypothetical protein
MIILFPCVEIVGLISNRNVNLFKVCKSVHHRTIQINHQPDATVFQFIILKFIYSSTCCGRFPAATAVTELLMMGGKTPETRWAVNKRQDNKLENCCIWLVIYFNYKREVPESKWKRITSCMWISLTHLLKCVACIWITQTLNRTYVQKYTPTRTGNGPLAYF